MRPTLACLNHMVSAGHYLAAHAGFGVLEAGGNAVDAGVAAGIALSVVQSDFVNFAGVAPILVYMADTRQVSSISGLGWWPRAAPPRSEKHRSELQSIMRTWYAVLCLKKKKRITA